MKQPRDEAASSAHALGVLETEGFIESRGSNSCHWVHDKLLVQDHGELVDQTIIRTRTTSNYSKKYNDCPAEK